MDRIILLQKYGETTMIKTINGIRTIKCSCGETIELCRGDSICDKCETWYNCGGDKLRSKHSTEEHYEAEEYVNG
jgi:hypothetical protein